jgi:ribokinase
MGFGGKGANQAVMAAKLGADVAVVTKLGRDPFGENTFKNFQKWGVNTKSVFFTEQAFSGVAPIAVDPNGSNAIIIVTGANDLLTSEEIESCRPVISAAQILICQLEIPLEITLEAMRIARQEGVLTILNPAPAHSALPEEFYRLSDLFCPNETETELLTGLPVGTITEAEIAARTLLKRGTGKVILTLGERGSLLVSNDNTVLVPAERVQAIDTTGAGDAFVGSLAYFLAAGHPAHVAMQKANQICAISVQALGTQTSFPVAAELPSSLFS